MAVRRKLALSAAVALYAVASVVGGFAMAFALDRHDHLATTWNRTYLGGAILGIFAGAIALWFAAVTVVGVRIWWRWVRKE